MTNQQHKITANILGSKVEGEPSARADGAYTVTRTDTHGNIRVFLFIIPHRNMQNGIAKRLSSLLPSANNAFHQEHLENDVQAIIGEL